MVAACCTHELTPLIFPSSRAFIPTVDSCDSLPTPQAYYNIRVANNYCEEKNKINSVMVAACCTHELTPLIFPSSRAFIPTVDSFDSLPTSQAYYNIRVANNYWGEKNKINSVMVAACCTHELTPLIFPSSRAFIPTVDSCDSLPTPQAYYNIRVANNYCGEKNKINSVMVAACCTHELTPLIFPSSRAFIPTVDSFDSLPTPQAYYNIRVANNYWGEKNKINSVMVAACCTHEVTLPTFPASG